MEQLKIADTSALVLNWTLTDVWQTETARHYVEHLDLSEADRLLALFNEQERQMHTQCVTGRKFFMRKCALSFIEKYQQQQQSPQIIILAAGIAPLSVELTALFPQIKIFDVDRDLMAEKEKMLRDQFSNIQFLTCDISNLENLTQQLVDNGWNHLRPTLVILEGIIYYLKEEDLKNILHYFAENHADLACDFALEPECVAMPNRTFGIEVFRKIEAATGIPKVRFYTPEYFIEMLKNCGYQNIQLQTSAAIQIERTGKAVPFEDSHSSWINFIQTS